MKMSIGFAAVVVASVVSASAVSVALARPTVDFESVPLVGQFDNGGPATNSNGFNVGGVKFSNDFVNAGSFSFWTGFAISRVADGTTPGFGNQYAAFPGGGAGGSEKYGVYFDSFDGYLELPEGERLASARIANTTYAALSMLQGDAFAKKFGGASGNDPDYLLLTLTGHSGPGGTGVGTGSVSFYLADYRFADNSLDYVVSGWDLVDLTGLGAARSVTFSFESSDVGMFGINTPTYFAMDDLVVVPEAGRGGMGLVCVGLLAGRRRR